MARVPWWISVGVMSSATRAVGELERNGASHQPAKQYDPVHSSSDDVADGFVHVCGFGVAEG